MTTIQDKLFDGAKGGVGERLVFAANGLRDAGDSSGIVTPAPVDVDIDPTTGQFTTPNLDPGVYTVRIQWSASKPSEYYDILVPATGTNIRLFPLIATGLLMPAKTTDQRIQAAIDAYVEEHPISGGGGLDVAAVAAAIANPETAANSAVVGIVSAAIPTNLVPTLVIGATMSAPRTVPAGYTGPVEWVTTSTTGIPVNILNNDIITRVTSTVIPWTPASMPNAFAWFRASDTGGTDGAALPQWNDIGPSASRHAKQTVAGSQPTWRAAVNGKPAVEFDGTADFLITDAFTASVGEAWTVYAVAQSTPATLTGGSDFLLDGLSSAPAATRLATYRTTTSTVAISRGTAIASPPALDNAQHRIRSVFNGASSSVTVDANTPVTGSTSLSGIEVVKLALGARADGLNWWQGNIWELLFVKGVVTTDNDAKMAAYLQSTYGVA